MTLSYLLTVRYLFTLALIQPLHVYWIPALVPSYRFQVVLVFPGMTKNELSAHQIQ